MRVRTVDDRIHKHGSNGGMVEGAARVVEGPDGVLVADRRRRQGMSVVEQPRDVLGRSTAVVMCV